ncbi:MAG: hypothetical protein KME19_08915 [Microcoleus vaginatus WJT46-NPBG5]|jgi:ribosomal protein S27AE|nr:hypothetical protein [Microcoleus vaginatus WJT46-NPBG5]MBW4680221.1 hypothetical protein [Microcoleus vaginatus WJT46-NPBG5]
MHDTHCPRCGQELCIDEHDSWCDSCNPERLDAAEEYHRGEREYIRDFGHSAHAEYYQIDEEEE